MFNILRVPSTGYTFHILKVVFKVTPTYNVKRQTDRQTDKQTDRQTDRHRQRQTQTDTDRHRQTDRHTTLSVPNPRPCTVATTQ